MKKIITTLTLYIVFASAIIIAQPKIVEDNGYSITYVLNGGVNSSNNKDSYLPGKEQPLAEPNRDGFLFGGWFENFDFSGERITHITEKSKGPKKFFAKWINQNLINIDSDMVEVIPSGKKVVLENFARIEGMSEIKGYKISKYEVTQELYEAVMGINPSWFNNTSNETKILNGEKQSRRPVECVTWFDAIYFCNALTKLTLGESECCYKISKIERRNDRTDSKISYIYSCVVEYDLSKKGYRLPTESEWEFAARGGTTEKWDKAYSGSKKIKDVAWFRENSGGITHEVGKKLPNSLGLYDMTGNVSELYTPKDVPRYKDINAIFIGGSCLDSSNRCEITFRAWSGYMGGPEYGPDFLDGDLGFRLAQSN